MLAGSPQAVAAFTAVSRHLTRLAGAVEADLVRLNVYQPGLQHAGGIVGYELFAALGSHRDRALVALWVSTGARASELLGVTCGDTDPGRQVITVVRKGSRALQQLPGSPDAFVWLRLYQQQMLDLVPSGRDQPSGGRCGARFAG